MHKELPENIFQANQIIKKILYQRKLLSISQGKTDKKRGSHSKSTQSLESLARKQQFVELKQRFSDVFVDVKYKNESSENMSEQQLTDHMYGKSRLQWYKEVQLLACKYQLRNNTEKPFKIMFREEEHVDSNLYNRAFQYLLNLIGDIPEASRDYISYEQERKYELYLHKKNYEKLGLYLALKIHLYIRMCYQYLITKMTLYFLNDP